MRKANKKIHKRRDKYAKKEHCRQWIKCLKKNALYLIIIGKSTTIQESADQKKPRKESTIEAVPQNIRFYTFMTPAHSKKANIFFFLQL